MSQPLTTSARRHWGALLHASAILGFVIPLGSVLAPLVVWLLVRHRDAWLDKEGRAAVNFQLSMLLYFVIGGIVLLTMIGVVIWVYVGAAVLYCSIAAAVWASKGRSYPYPLAIWFIGPPHPVGRGHAHAI